MPVLPFDALLVFVLAMLWRATAVTYLTHLVAAAAGLRGRCLSRWLRALLEQAGPHSPCADAILRHPMIGSRRRCGETISREQLRSVLQVSSPPETLQAVDLWFDQAMRRATREYRRLTAILTALSALAILGLTDRSAFADPATLLFLWIPLSLGSPFWYDLLKRLAV